MNRRASHRVSRRARESERCFPGVIPRSLGLGWARCFLQRTNQILKLLQASDGPTLPSLTDRSLWSSTSLCAPLPPTIWYQRGKGRNANPLGRAMLSSPRAQVANTRPADRIQPSTLFYLAQRLVSTLQWHRVPCP